MRQEMQDKNDLRPVIHARNQTILVPSDVEDGSAADQIGVVIDLLQIGRCPPIRTTHHGVPRFETGFRLRVLLPELFQGAALNDAHEGVCSHKENYSSIGNKWPGGAAYQRSVMTRASLGRQEAAGA